MPEDVINDAHEYGVEIEPVAVPEGTTYWRVIRVRHLTPAENHGNHHIYLDALDEAGSRVSGAQARIAWEGGQQTVTIDKPPSEPGTNFPMWKWQVCAAMMLGLPSDRVTGMHTGHPDEPPGTGNTLFHHSFHVDFQRAVKEAEVHASSVITGVVANGEGRTLLLRLADDTVRSSVLDATGNFRFEELAAGSYELVVEGTDMRSGAIELDGANTVTLALMVPSPELSDKIIDRAMLFGPPESPRTDVYLALAREFLAGGHATFGFRAEDAAQADTVILMGELQDIDAATEATLLAAGCQVQRVQGTPEEIMAALQALTGDGPSRAASLPAVPP